MKALAPDIVIMDVSMPKLNGVEATLRLQDASPMSRVIALSMHRDGVYARDILRVGARGYFTQGLSAASDLLVAIRAVMRNELTEYRKTRYPPVGPTDTSGTRGAPNAELRKIQQGNSN